MSISFMLLFESPVNGGHGLNMEPTGLTPKMTGKYLEV